MRTKAGSARLGVDAIFEYQRHFVSGAVATDGIQYTGVVTFGTTATSIYEIKVDPGVNLHHKEIEVALTAKFTGLNGSLVGSLIYYWQARSEAFVPSSGFGALASLAYVPISGTYQKAVGTLTTSEDTFSGYIPVGSVPYAPVWLKLTAVGIQAAVMTGQVKASSYVRGLGPVIPGV